MVRVLLLAACAALAATTLAACGSTQSLSKQEYAEVIGNSRDRVDYALAQITVGTGSLEVLVQRMNDAADSIDEAASDLDVAGAADGFDDETSDLVDAFHELAAGLAGTASDATQVGMEGLLTGSQALQFPGWTKANRVLASLKEQGIAVEPISSH
jgi:ABC-type oligopeptide transport system substrate-binding subunit